MHLEPLTADPASFRDPSGSVFVQEGVVYRSVAAAYSQHYDLLISSGLYDRLQLEKILISHSEESTKLPLHRLLRPTVVPFISYPYEWSFSQLKDAALVTLRIQKVSLEHEMTLKDASAYNIQFYKGKPLLIDTLSFEKYIPGQPWIAYKQYCQHFLAPLALMSLVDLRVGPDLLKAHIDGVPLDLASRLLPNRSRLKVGLGVHLHLHARMQRQLADKNKAIQSQAQSMTKQRFKAFLANLEATTRSLCLPAVTTEWGGYYEATNYSNPATVHKLELVAKYIQEAKPSLVWDLGANRGEYSRLAKNTGAMVLSCDVDPIAVERNYLEVREKAEEYILPLLIDLTSPSPAVGWANQERLSFLLRSKPQLVMALALVHHLAIGTNIPLTHIAQFLASSAPKLIIEFIPKEDSNVQRLLSTRKDIYPDYTYEGFERAFTKYYTVLAKNKINQSERTLYYMQLKKEYL